MSYALVGPYAFDLKTVVSSTRAALSEVGRTLRGGGGAELIEGAATGVDGGLYVLLRHDGPDSKPLIDGFWVVADGEYLNNGPMGAPERIPPFAAELLDAATEEVWWETLPVELQKDGAWHPLIVLEYPPHVANRSSMPPPGVPFEDEEAVDGTLEERETWLEAVAAGNVPRAGGSDIPIMNVEKELDRYPELTDQRSVVVLVRGTLRHDRRLHTGRYFMIAPDALDDGSNRVVPLDDWIDAAIVAMTEDEHGNVYTGQEGERHRLGAPLGLFHDRIGFHSSAWLTRTLAIWPARPSDIEAASLTDRVVQQQWIAQAWLALTSSVVVLFTVLGFSGAVNVATAPRPQSLQPPPPPAAQPAMSVCSADYQEYVDELRCQIQALASVSGESPPTSPVCGDQVGNGSRLLGRTPATPDDLQATYCALLDRERDKWTADLGRGDRANFAALAASQACFNVLGHPFPYRLRAADGDERLLGDPSKFLAHEELSIQPLRELVAELGLACEGYRERVEAVVEGAVYATHVGSPLDEDPAREQDAAKLRRALLFPALANTKADGQRCFKHGMSFGLDGGQYYRMCGDLGANQADKFEDTLQTSKIWTKLGGAEGFVPTVSLVDRYAAARFANPKSDRAPLWACHLALDLGEPFVLGARMGLWDIPIPTPEAYDIRGTGVKNQLTLDATLRSGTDAGVCWSVVSKRLSAYSPVHPLLSDLEPDGWPSVEQRLCGQVCAARYGVRRSIVDAQWVTRDLDLAQCVSGVRGPENDQGFGRLDRLRLPWNEVRGGEWVEPTQDQVCAFNLIAQDLLPPLEGGYVVQGVAAKEFAGETVAGSRIAGGELGLAARYVKGLAFGRRDAVSSISACGHVATQCFTSVLLEVTGDKDIERYRWKDAWLRKVEEMADARRSELAEKNPWCVGIQDYLIPEREIAQFDTPCVTGVAAAREKLELVMGLLENDTVPAPGG